MDPTPKNPRRIRDAVAVVAGYDPQTIWKVMKGGKVRSVRDQSFILEELAKEGFTPPAAPAVVESASAAPSDGEG